MRGLQFAFLLVLFPFSLQGNEHTASHAGITGSVRKVTPNFIGLNTMQRNGIYNVKLQLQAANAATAFVNPLSTPSLMESVAFDSRSECCRRTPPVRLRRRLQTRALLNLGNGHSWPDMRGVSETVGRAMQGMLGKQSISSSHATSTLQRKRQEEAEKFVRAIEGEISQWIKKVGDLEDKRLAELNQSLEAIYDVLNQKFSAPRGSSAFMQIRASLKAWRALRRSTDPSTKDFLLAMERIRRDYDEGIIALTSTVQPLTEDEVREGFERAGGRELQRAIEEGVDSAFTIQHALEDALQKSLQPLNRQILDGELDQELVVVVQGLQQAENMIRAGIERARYNVLQRTQRRTREPEAARVTIRDGVVYASSMNCAVEVPVLEGLGVEMYVDDTDGSVLFMGVKTAEESSQHVVRLGSLAAGAGRWLACARQKLWWMSPDVGGRGDPIPAETQFFLADVGQGMYAVLLPLVGSTFRSALWGAEGGGLSLRLESGDPGETDMTVPTSLLIAAGSDPFKLLERAFAAVADRTGTFRVRSEKPLPPSLDVFGWCTWDAFYSRVTPEGVKEGLAGLIKGGTPARLLILDDGWQSTDNDEEYRVAESDARDAVDAAELAGGGVIEGDDYASKQLTALKDVPARLLTWWYKTVVDKSPYDSMPVRIWQWLTHNVIKHEMLRYFAEATDWSKRLTSILPNHKFVRLMNLVKDVKEDYGLKYTYCWHALTGYWLGVDPKSPGMARFHPVIQYPCISPHFDYTPGMLHSEPTMLWNPSSFVGMGLIPPNMIKAFYNELHQSLRDAGIDGVKVDAQAAITMLGVGYGGGPSITRAYVHAMEQSVKDNMGGNCINCMCHPTENLYSYKETNVARASDDFYPREPASHTVHVANVVYNSLFLGEIVQPDWDMFQSEHPAAGLHAAARAVGGCAVYTSDRPGVHDFALLRKLVLPDGSVLRALLPGRPTRDCLFADVCADGSSALKVWNRNPTGGVLGLFNIQGASWDRAVRQFRRAPAAPTVVARATPADVEGLRSPAGRFAVWSHGRQSLALLGPDDAFAAVLAPQHYDVLTVAPVLRLRGVDPPDGGAAGDGEGLFAAVGLAEMFNGGGAVLSCSVGAGGLPSLQTLLQGVLDQSLPAAAGAAGAAGAGGAGGECLVGLEDGPCLVPAPDLAPAGGRVEMAVKGQGTLVCYTNVKPASATLRPQSGATVGLVGVATADRGAREECEWDYDAATGTLRIVLPRMPPPPPPAATGAAARAAAWTVEVVWEKRPVAAGAGSAAAGAQPAAAPAPGSAQEAAVLEPVEV